MVNRLFVLPVCQPLSVLKPLVMEDLGVARSALGAVDTALLAAYALGQIFMGRACAVLSTKNLLTLAFVCSGFGTALMGTAKTARGMAGWSALVGLGASVVNPLMVRNLLALRLTKCSVSHRFFSLVPGALSWGLVSSRSPSVSHWAVANVRAGSAHIPGVQKWPEPVNPYLKLFLHLP